METQAAADVPLRRHAGTLIELAQARDRAKIRKAEIGGADQVPMLLLQAGGFLHGSVLEDAGGRIVTAGPCRKTAPDAGQDLCEERPHLAQCCPHRLVNTKQIEADGIPGGGS